MHFSFSVPTGLLAFGSSFRVSLPATLKCCSDLGFNQCTLQSPITATGSPRILTVFRDAGFAYKIVLYKKKTSRKKVITQILPKDCRLVLKEVD